MTSYRCLILDLDGTVVDSHPYTFAAFRHACEPFGHNPSDAVIHAAFGPDERVILRRLVGPRHAAAAYERLMAYYVAHVHDLHVESDLCELLDQCHAHGIRRGLFTGRGRDSTNLMLDALALGTRFDAVVAGDEARPKPAADGVLALLRALGCSASETLVVGDSPLDLRAAAGAGTDAALATWFAGGVPGSDVVSRRLASPPELRALLGLAAGR